MKNGTNIQEIELELSRITNIVFKAQEAFLIVKYLISEEEDSYASYEKNMNAFFPYSMNIYWQITTLELCKLFLDRESFNLIKFIDKLKSDGHYGSLNIQTEKISIWEQRIATSQPLIENLKLQRDKLYAHDDPNNHNIINTLTISDTWNLIEISHEIIKEINLTCFERGTMIEVINSPAINLQSFIGRLADERKNYMEGYRQIAEQEGLGDELL